MKKSLLLAFAFALACTFALAQESNTPKDPQQNDPAAQTKPDDKSTTPAQETTGAESKNESSSKDTATEGRSKTKASNNSLTEQLHDKFAADPALANVKFRVSKGVVTLTGKVDSAEEMAHAKEVAMSVDGVKTVRNRLKVASTSAATGSDTHANDTAEAKNTTPDLKPNVAGTQGVENNSTGAIGKDASSANPQISAGGNNSTTPTTNASGGTVPSNAGSIAGNTEAASGTQSGALPAGDQSAAGSSNSDSASLQSTIQDKLKSEPMLSSSSVNVTVTDATIELSGSVATGKEKQTAERIAQSYAGNRKLVNRITVSGNGNSSSSSSGQATPVQPDKSAPTSANPSSTNGNPPTNQTPSTPEQSTEPKK